MATNHNATTTSDTDTSKIDLASIKDTLETLMKSFMQTKENATEKAKAAMDQASTTVREKPIASMIVVFLIGLIFGRLYTMLRRS